MIEIKPKLYKDITDYCKLNNIPDVNAFIEKLIRDGFAVKKYGETPMLEKPTPPIEIKESPPLITEVKEVEPPKKAKKEKKIKDKDDYSIYDD